MLVLVQESPRFVGHGLFTEGSKDGRIVFPPIFPGPQSREIERERENEREREIGRERERFREATYINRERYDDSHHLRNLIMKACRFRSYREEKRTQIG
jgi:hypothetical protein